MKQFITIQEVDEAIKGQEAARDQALAQANFHAGYIAALKEIGQGIGIQPEEFPDVILLEETNEVAPAGESRVKNGRKQR